MTHLRRAAGAALLLLAAARAFAQPAGSDTDAAVHADPDAGVLHVTGPIGPRFERDVRAALRRHRGLRRIDIASPGGLRAPALRIGALANARRITVRVDGRCASACVLLWATADAREITARSRIGLHGSTLDPDLALPAVVRRQLVARNDRETDAVLLRAGFPEDVVARGAATPPTTMAWFTPGELHHRGVPFALLEPPQALHAAVDGRASGTTAAARE